MKVICRDVFKGLFRVFIVLVKKKHPQPYFKLYSLSCLVSPQSVQTANIEEKLSQAS